MSLHPLAGKPAPYELLVNVPRLISAYYTGEPDPTDPAQRVAFGTSGHRGSSFRGSFNEGHILAISQAICEFRQAQGITGPLFIGIDTHALSEPALASVDRLGDLRIGECEDSMARILELTGDLRLKEDSPLPGVMSPMDMLKAGALLALKKIGATGRRPEVEKIYHETPNRILKNMAAETLEAFGVRVEKEQK